MARGPQAVFRRMAASHRPRLALAFAAMAILGGCDPALDPDQARVCRIALRGVVDGDAAITILAQRAGTGSAVRIDFQRGGVPDPGHFIECRFGKGTDRLEVTGLRTDAEVLSGPRLFMLNRFWVGADDAASDPLPLPGAARAPDVPTGTGYALQQIINAIPGATAYGLLAAAYSLVYGLIGRVNLAFGGFAAIGGAAALLVGIGMQGAWPATTIALAAIIVASSAAAFHGIAATRLVFRPLTRSSGQQALVATMGLSLFLGAYLQLAQGAAVRWIIPMFDAPFAVAREGMFLVTMTPMAVFSSLASLTVALALLLHLKRSRFGREWRACGDDPDAAALFGVDRDAVLGRTLTIATALAGFSGCITCLSFGTMDTAYAATLALKALTAAVVGGIGSVSGAFLGGLSIGLLEAAWSAAFPISDRDLVVFVVLIVVLMARPGGFFGDRDLAPRRV